MTADRRAPDAVAPLADARLLGRHQIAAAIASCADFGSMVVLVELARLSPPLATMLSALVGGVVNFTLSRRWAFHTRHAGTARSQALRYSVVSVGGALINASLLALVLYVSAIAYPLARALVAIAVSVLYTYPLHTRFVFRVVRRPRDLAGSP